jgi:group I intron endonuclease
MCKTHYTYIIEDIVTGNFYIGSRSCNGKAEDDCYMGSMVVWKPNKENLKKIILNDKFSNREEAIADEIKLIKENISNPLNQNYNIPGLGFHNTGRVFSDETREKMRLARIGSNNPRYGNPHSEETKLKIKKRAIGRKASDSTKTKMSESHFKKEVIQFDKNMNVIAEYESIKQAGILTNTDKGDISKVCNNKQKTAGGYIWKIKY